MTIVKVEPAGHRVTLQGGDTADPVIREIQRFGLVVPMGNLGAVGEWLA